MAGDLRFTYTDRPETKACGLVIPCLRQFDIFSDAIRAGINGVGYAFRRDAHARTGKEAAQILPQIFGVRCPALWALCV